MEQNKLGSKLYLQLDNTCAENKNMTMLGWASVVVSMDWFEMIMISFLPVGHTGEDIDSLWGRLINIMKVDGVVKLEEILSTLLKAGGSAENEITVVPEFITGGVVDFRSWLQECTLAFSNILQVFFFKFGFFCNFFFMFIIIKKFSLI